MDLQGRLTSKQYADGSSVNYFYENSISRMRQVTDEKLQSSLYSYNRDNTLRAVAYANTTVPTPGVQLTYDSNYERHTSMTDGTGTTLYSYNPITVSPALGAGQMASEDGPLPNDTITYGYDELGRRNHRAISGVGSAMTYDQAGRPTSNTNALGAFTFAYDGVTARMLSETLPNGQTLELSYGGNLDDQALQRITHKVGATPVSEFIYAHDIAADRITTWSQQAGVQSPDLFTFGYDAVNQLLSGTVTNAGAQLNLFGYSYDPLGNRRTEQVGASNYTASYNALNQISTSTGPGISRTNEWDGKDRLVAVNMGNQRTEFTYDGRSRMVSIRQLTNNVEASLRRFVWCGNTICEERNAAGAVTKRFFPQGMKVETGANAGSYYYTRDHLGSVREVVDATGTVRARYAYDPYGRRTRLTGDLDSDFGFAGMFWSSEAGLALTHFRAYDPNLGRWLSRDPLKSAELTEGPNLYAYVGDDPINKIDPEGLTTTVDAWCVQHPAACAELAGLGVAGARAAQELLPARNTLPGMGPAAEALGELCAVAGELFVPEVEAALPAVDAELIALVDRAIELANKIRPGEFGRSQWSSAMRMASKGFQAVRNYVGNLYPGGPSVPVTELEAIHQTAVRLTGYDPSTWLW